MHFPRFATRSAASPAWWITGLLRSLGPLLLLGLAGGCASGPREGARPETTFEPANPTTIAPFRNADLRLTRLVSGDQEVKLTGAAPITARLADAGKIAGQSAVNRYFGSYQLSADGTVKWPPAALGMTRMAGPPAAMDLESKFVSALTSTTQLQVSSDSLRFRSADGANVVVFSR